MSDEPAAPPFSPRPKSPQTNSSFSPGGTLITKKEALYFDYTAFDELDASENDNIGNLVALIRSTSYVYLPFMRMKSVNQNFHLPTMDGYLDTITVSNWQKLLRRTAQEADSCRFDWDIPKSMEHEGYTRRHEIKENISSDMIQGISIPPNPLLLSPLPLTPEQNNEQNLLISTSNIVTASDLSRSNCSSTAWYILLPESSSIRVDRLSTDFCQYFFLIVHQLELGMKVSYRVPVHIRAKYDNTYRCVWKKMHSSSPSMLAEWIASCSEDDSQGVNLIAVLEITLETHGFKGCRRRLTEVQSWDVKLESLQHASTDQLSNFLATSIEILAHLDQTDDGKATRDDGLAIMRKIWIWSRHRDFFLTLESLFVQTIKRLETKAIPLCLWFFLTILRSLLIENSDYTVLSKVLCQALRKSLPEQEKTFFGLTWLPSAMLIMQFLQLDAHSEFFGVLHHAMQDFCGDENWRGLWYSAADKDKEMWSRFQDMSKDWDIHVAGFTVPFVERLDCSARAGL